MSWSTIKTDLETLKSNLQNIGTSASAEVPTISKEDLGAFAQECSEISDVLHNVLRSADDKRIPAPYELASKELSLIQAAKDCTKSVTMNRHGRKATVVYSSKTLEKKVTRTFEYRVSDRGVYQVGSDLIAENLAESK